MTADVSRNTIKGIFKKNKKSGSKSPMFKSPSHYWNASSTGFLHSKGSAHVELSVDPFNKSLIRIYCQSVDKMIHYKSIEYSARTTVKNIVDKMIKLLRLNKSYEEFVLSETVGRCMAVDESGGTKNKVAKSGQNYIFIEQNRRILMFDDYILTILNYWKPMYGLARRFDLCLASKASKMIACDEVQHSPFLTNDSNSAFSGDSPRSFSIRSVDNVEKSTQTEIEKETPPLVPKRKSVLRNSQKHYGPQLILLKGDNKEIPPIYNIDDKMEFGTKGSQCKFILTRFSNLQNITVLTVTKEVLECENNDSSNQVNYGVFIETNQSNNCIHVLLNGMQLTDSKVPLTPGDIIELGYEYAFFFKDLKVQSDSSTRIKHFMNKSTNPAICNNDIDDFSMSEMSDVLHQSSSITSGGSDNNGRRVKKTKIVVDANGITLECFDVVLNQIIIHYFNDSMDLTYTTTFIIFLIRYCRESNRCSFTMEQMQDQITIRFDRALEDAYENDYFLMAQLKVASLFFQMWLLYHYENQTREENRYWLSFFETYVGEHFEYVADYVCKLCADLSLCICEETPLMSYEDHDLMKQKDDLKTMDKFLDFLNNIYRTIDAIGDNKTIDIIKKVMTSRIVIAVTESIITVLLSEMRTYTWHRGIQVLTQIEKLETWLKAEGYFDLYEKDGFLNDMSKLMSVRLNTLQQMSWLTIRKQHSRIPPCVLRQFLLGISKGDINIIKNWEPGRAELKDINQDVTMTLINYRQSESEYTIFHPGLVLQIDCIPISKLLDSVEFITLATILDTELTALNEYFRWMALSRPDTLINFSSGCWDALRQSIGASVQENKQSSVSMAPSRKAIDKIKQKRSQQQDSSDYYSSSQKTLLDVNSFVGGVRKNSADTMMSMAGKSNSYATYSKSMLTLYDEQQHHQPQQQYQHQRQQKSNSTRRLLERKDPPIVPRRKCHNIKGSMGNLTVLGGPDSGASGDSSIQDRRYPCKRMESFSGKSCMSRICRSDSIDSSDFLNTPNSALSDNKRMQPAVHVDSDSSSDISDIDKSIAKMEKMQKQKMVVNNFDQVDESEDDDEEDMSIGLSAAGLDNRLNRKGRRSSSDIAESSVEVDSRKEIDVVLERGVDKKYGFTIVDGMQTELRTEGIYVYKLDQDSVAAKSQKLRPGDKILAINSYNVEYLSFDDCLLLIKKSRISVMLKVEKCSMQTSMKIMSIYK